jgi:hypothetical protein
MATALGGHASARDAYMPTPSRGHGTLVVEIICRAGLDNGAPRMTNASSLTSDQHTRSVWQVVLGYVVVAAVFIGLILAVL